MIEAHRTQRAAKQALPNGFHVPFADAASLVSAPSVIDAGE